MARRAVTTSVGSMPISGSSARRLVPFTSIILRILLSILQMIILKPLGLVLTRIIGDLDFTTYGSSADLTQEANPRNLYTVVQGRDLPPVRAEIHNDNVLDLPELVPPVPPPRRMLPLTGSLNGIPLD
ncbi:unnamed protein product [Rhizoctonia solani]|uniref:Uncharacterized protein n=1 Tax=Rhizoctonia solani TaxID=456999 RepID=A0A8H3ARU3_9AGAM|nr:unnamed protein product [Rhizoctonia solani]